MPVIDLGYRPRPWQAKMHRSLKRFSVLVVHRRGGKTVAAILALLDAALRCSKPDGRYGYIAPYREQAKAIAWSYLKRYASKIPGTKVNESELWIELPNGARIRLFGADNADALRGLYFDGVVLDEVADMRPDVWGEIIRPALADRLGWALFIGTPKGVNLFSELYYAAMNDTDWYAGLFTYLDTGAIAAAEIEQMRTGPTAMAENHFRQEFLCDFSSGSANALISTVLVEEACRRHLRTDQYGYAPVILGVDVARYGDDRSVICRRQGMASFAPVVMRGCDSNQVAAAVAIQITEHHADAVFIDGSGGYGSGVIDRLRSLGYQGQMSMDVQFGGKPDDPRFLNKRAEMWFRLADWIKQGAALPNDPALKLDLCAQVYSLDNAANKFALESKDDMKARGLPSPDMGDAWALTFAYPVAPKGTGARLATRAISDYNPLDG